MNNRKPIPDLGQDPNTKYLGDGVYIHYDGWHLVLTTGSHDNTESAIYLDPEVTKNLQRYINKFEADDE